MSCAHQSGPAERKTMINRTYHLPITKQAKALGISRGSIYARLESVSERDQNLITRMELEALYRKPRTTQRHSAHTVYPYLLRNLAITRANYVCAKDVTYIPMAKGFVYLVAVVDWYTCLVLSWRVAITMDLQFCLDPRDRPGSLWEARNHQYGSGQSVCQSRLYGFS